VFVKGGKEFMIIYGDTPEQNTFAPTIQLLFCPCCGGLSGVSMCRENKEQFGVWWKTTYYCINLLETIFPILQYMYIDTFRDGRFEVHIR
jgi:hypothetical protein